MKKIYDFKVGDTVRIYTMEHPMGSAYTVDSTVNDMISCHSEDGDNLFFPAYVPMPFAIVKVSEQDAEGETDEDSDREAPESAAKKAPEQKLEKEVAVKPERKTAFVEKKAETVFQPVKEEIVFDGTRYESYLDYYNSARGWGKIHEEGNKYGLFFNIKEVKDEKLRYLLNGIEVGASCPRVRLSYVKQPNVFRNNAPCAGEIRMIDLQESAANETKGGGENELNVPYVGYLYERYDDGRCTVVDVNGKRYKVRMDNIESEALKKYVLEVLPYGSLDSYNVKVEFLMTNKGVVLHQWLNQEQAQLGKVNEACAVEKAPEVVPAPKTAE